MSSDGGLTRPSLLTATTWKVYMVRGVTSMLAVVLATSVVMLNLPPGSCRYCSVGP